MASWKKYFSAVPSTTRLVSKQDASTRSSGSPAGSGAKYASYLPEVYSGAPNRIERYIQYEQMDLDSEINKGLDIISDYSTQNYDIDQEPFTINYKDTMSETEVKLLKDMLAQWCSINRWQQRIWRAFRNVIKYALAAARAVWYATLVYLVLHALDHRLGPGSAEAAGIDVEHPALGRAHDAVDEDAILKQVLLLVYLVDAFKQAGAKRPLAVHALA